jgi:hypothetical protein
LLDSTSKLVFNSEGDKFYLGGKHGLGVYHCTPTNDLLHMKNMKIGSPVIEIYKGRQNDMILRYEKSNDLALVTGDLLEIDNIIGVFDTPQARQHM